MQGPSPVLIRDGGRQSSQHSVVTAERAGEKGSDRTAWTLPPGRCHPSGDAETVGSWLVPSLGPVPAGSEGRSFGTLSKRPLLLGRFDRPQGCALCLAAPAPSDPAEHRSCCPEPSRGPTALLPSSRRAPSFLEVSATSLVPVHPASVLPPTGSCSPVPCHWGSAHTQLPLMELLRVPLPFRVPPSSLPAPPRWPRLLAVLPPGAVTQRPASTASVCGRPSLLAAPTPVCASVQALLSGL